MEITRDFLAQMHTLSRDRNDLSRMIPEKQAPRLRIAIGLANRDASLGMTDALMRRKLCRIVNYFVNAIS